MCVKCGRGRDKLLVSITPVSILIIQRWWRRVRWDPVGCGVLWSLLSPTVDMWRVLGVQEDVLIISLLQCKCGGVVCWDYGVLFSVLGFLLSGFGGRDARPCEPRVRNDRCPASALKCFEPDPLCDASGKFFLVMASVNVVFVTVAGVMCAPLC